MINIQFVIVNEFVLKQLFLKSTGLVHNFCQPDSDITATIQKLLKEAPVTLKEIHIHFHQKKMRPTHFKSKGKYTRQ